jgi:hypothetical protein
MQHPDCFEKTDSLKSGCFYTVEAIQHCYRINEPDHFLKDMEIHFMGYFDNKEQFHHFNRLKSHSAAKTSLLDLFSLTDLKSLDFYQLKDRMLEDTDYSSDGATEMVKKTVDAFIERSESDHGIIHSVEELKRKHLKEYLAPPDLAH